MAFHSIVVNITTLTSNPKATKERHHESQVFCFIFRETVDVRWHMAASNLSWFNSGLNPIVYAILNPNFRQEYIRFIKLVTGKLKGKIFRHRTTEVINKEKGGIADYLQQIPLSTKK